MLEARNVTKKYGKKTAVADATFLGERGRIHGLVGENGAGKTTLLKCMAGIYRPEGGSITYDGKPVYDNEKMLERVAFISDSQEFFSIYTAKGLLRFGSVYEAEPEIRYRSEKGDRGDVKRTENAVFIYAGDCEETGLYFDG